MINKNNYFRFYDLCIPVKGYSKGVIYDLQRSSLYHIPNSVIDMLLENKDSKINEIYYEYKGSEKLVSKYLSFLIKNELIFLTTKPEKFPKSNFNFNKPFLLDILFIEIDQLGTKKINFLKKLDSLGAIQIVLISKENISLNKLKKVLDILYFSKTQIISLVCRYCSYHPELLKIQFNDVKLRDITFYDSDKDICEEQKKLFFRKTNLYDTLTRKISNIDDFILNDDFFRESLNKNIFFNRKVYISNNGDIKHYINDHHIYGNISTDDIFSILNKESFRELWNINKDKIEICKACQYRYICADNRIPTKESNQKYTHKTKCKYDPISDTWN